MWILMSFLLIYEVYIRYIIVEIAPNIRQTFSIVFGWQPVMHVHGSSNVSIINI